MGPLLRRNYQPHLEPLEDRLLLFHCLLNFGSATYSGTEGGRVDITVVRSRFAEPAINVDVQAAGGSATSGRDFTGAATTLAWANGELGPKTFSINLPRDGTAEGTETVQLKLANPTGGAVLGSPATATLRIADGGATSRRPAVSIGDVQVTEGHGATTNARISVRLSRASSAPVTVKFATARGSASVGSDFLSAAGTVTFRRGQTRQTIVVKIKGDRVAEKDERFFVSLTRPSGASLSDRQAICTILDDDADRHAAHHDADAWLVPLAEAVRRR